MNEAEKLVKLFQFMESDLGTVRTLTEALSFAKDRQFTRMRKRAGIGSSNLEVAAYDSFLSVNKAVAEIQLALPESIVSNARHFITTMLERFTSSMVDGCVQDTLDLGLLLSMWRFGPGTSNGVKGTHTVDKIHQAMSCTSQAEALVLRLRESNIYLSALDRSGFQGVVNVRGSRLSAVPKNEDVMRTIAIEPSGNMALQLAAGYYLEGTLRLIGLNITQQQPLNQAKAKRGSVDGSLATIDLKSASDMISLQLVRKLLPRPWIWLLETIRSREIQHPKTGEWHAMHMMSTMGNGFTFPLMTLILCALIYAMRCETHGPSLFIDWADTAVFGDDIILPSNEYSRMSELLAQAGLVVNHDKSYHDGPFRESCGGDYYLGVDVTPFYVKRLQNASDVYVAINQCMTWSRKTSIWLPTTLSYLATLLDKVFFVPEWSSPDSGILTVLCPSKYSYLRPAPRKKSFYETDLTMMLAVGGYLEDGGSPRSVGEPYRKQLLSYTPRPKGRVKYVVKRARLPRGYLNGWDPVKGPLQAAEMAGLMAQLIFK